MTSFRQLLQVYLTQVKLPQACHGRLQHITTIVSCLISGCILGLPLAASANLLNLEPIQTEPDAAGLFSQTSAIQTPTTVITPINNKVNIRFVNLTGAKIDYQVISDTELRTLEGRSEMTLQNLPVPTTLAFRRQDFGFLRLSYQADQPTGTLVITAEETPDFASDRTSIYVDPSGKVFFN